MITDAEYRSLWTWGKAYVNTRCIERRDKSDPLPGIVPGTWYTWQFYPRRGLYNPEFLKAVVQMFEYRVQKEVGHNKFQLAGMESAAVPMIIGASLLLGIPAFSVRKERKPYGLKNWLEGVPIGDAAPGSMQGPPIHPICSIYGGEEAHGPHWNGMTFSVLTWAGLSWVARRSCRPLGDTKVAPALLMVR